MVTNPKPQTVCMYIYIDIDIDIDIDTDIDIDRLHIRALLPESPDSNFQNYCARVRHIANRCQVHVQDRSKLRV